MKQNTKAAQESLKMRNISPETKQAAEMFSKLSPEDKQLMLWYLEGFVTENNHREGITNEC